VIELHETVNSVYEIDEENKKARRLSGQNPPTEHFDPEGEWHDFDGLHRLANGGVVFYWPDQTCTVTSMSKEHYDCF
jgi:hypothetical protein